MSIYVILHGMIGVICIVGLARSWKVLKQDPAAIEFAKWPLSLLIVLLVCSAIAIIDLGMFDIVSNQTLNVLSAIELLYSAVVAAFCIPYLARVQRA
jgi:hypothetical protein